MRHNALGITSWANWRCSVSCLALAGCLWLAGSGYAAEAIVEGYQPATNTLSISLLIDGHWYKKTFTNFKKATIDVNGKPLRADQLGAGWKGDLALKMYTLTAFHVKCEPLEGTLNGTPTDRGVSIQTKVADKEIAQNVIFFPDMETKGLGDKKPKDLAKGDKVKLSVIVGSQPPIVITFELPKTPASQRAATQPAAGTPQKPKKPPATSQPTSQPAN